MMVPWPTKTGPYKSKYHTMIDKMQTNVLVSYWDESCSDFDSRSIPFVFNINKYKEWHWIKAAFPRVISLFSVVTGCYTHFFEGILFEALFKVLFAGSRRCLCLKRKVNTIMRSNPYYCSCTKVCPVISLSDTNHRFVLTAATLLP